LARIYRGAWSADGQDEALARLLEAVGHGGLALRTGNVLLHDYQYHGPGPDGGLSKYTAREDAAADIAAVV